MNKKEEKNKKNTTADTSNTKQQANYFTYTLPRWNITEFSGYEPKTTFWQDFSIADAFGLDAIQDTYTRAFHEWHDNVIYLTELVLVLNYKIWQWYNKPNDNGKAKLYNDLWIEADAYAVDHLTGEDLSYYFQTTD